MGRFSSFGTLCSGNGGQISYDGILAGGNVGTCAQWLTDNLIIANVQFPDGIFRVGQFDVWNPGAGWIRLDERGANALAAGGGRWAAFTPAVGVFGHITDAIKGLSLQGTDQRGGAAPDGTLATVANYQVGTGLELNGVEIAPNQICRNVHVLGSTSAVWDGGGNVHVGQVLPYQRMRIVGDWRVYYTPQWGIVAHPVDRPQEGRVLAQVGYHHDAIAMPDGRVLVGYSTGIQELPSEWKVVNALDFAITDLTESAPLEPVPAIGKPCWLGWFEFQEPANPGPHNCLLRVKRGGLISSDEHVAQWVQGSSVDEIEAKAAEVAAGTPALNPIAPVAYWDAREWPRWPTLPANAWIALQAYQRVEESDATFEADLRRLITDASQRYAQVALVCQCYTSNAGNTSDLMGLPPIYARLARDFVSVTMLLVFSDEGRATGLNDHPEMRARWQELYDGITGTPNTEDPPMSNGIVDGVCVDPKAYIFSLLGWTDGQHVPNWQTQFNDPTFIASIEQYGFGLQRRTPPAPAANPNVTEPKGHPSSRVYVPSAVCSNAKPRPAHTTQINGQTYTESQLGVIQVEPCWQGWFDTVDDATQTAVWRPSGQPYVPIPAVDPGPGPDPTPGYVVVLLPYASTFQRSQPRPFVLEYEIGTPNGAAYHQYVRLGLNDGAPAFKQQILPDHAGPFVPGDKDGRYVKALGWKPDRNGTWRPFAELVDLDGTVLARVEGTTDLTVTE